MPRITYLTRFLMQLSTIIASYLASLPEGTTLSNNDLLQQLPDTPRKLATRAREKACKAGFVTYIGYREKGRSPSYQVSGSWTGSKEHYEKLESITEEEAGQSHGKVLKLQKSYKPIPEAGDPFESGLYRLVPGDSIEGVRDSLPEMLPTVIIRTRGIVKWDDGFETGFYAIECKGKRKTGEVHIDDARSTNHASLVAAKQAIELLTKPCIVVWQTTAPVVKVTGKNAQLSEDLITRIEKNNHIVFWQESTVIGNEFIDLFKQDENAEEPA